jgi:WD40 repeat protein
MAMKEILMCFPPCSHYHYHDLNHHVPSICQHDPKTIEYCAPLTSFDWNEANPALVGTCSIDTTCTIWDLNTLTPKTQLIGTNFISASSSSSVFTDDYGLLMLLMMMMMMMMSILTSVSV